MDKQKKRANKQNEKSKQSIKTKDETKLIKYYVFVFFTLNSVSFILKNVDAH